MPQQEKLPYVLKLVDDRSEAVRERVLQELSGYGDDLTDVLTSTDLAEEDVRRVALRVRHFTKTGEVLPAEFQEFDGQVVVAEPLFRKGQLMRHRRYGYRGVILEFDPECQADEAWYVANASQPPREQPWYHVLVHGSDRVTYVAQTNMVPDRTTGEIQHPLVSYYFAQFSSEEGYVRNERPWPPQ